MSKNVVNEIIDGWWQEVCQDVAAALLFIDNAAAESLHWHGGLNRILDNGGIGVRNFSISEKASPLLKRAIFIITSPFNDEVTKTLMTIIRSSRFKRCTVITSLPEQFHTNAASESNHSFQNLENNILHWMGNMNYTAEVLCIPVFAASLSSNVFIMPSLSKRFSAISSEFAFFESLKKTTEHGIKSLPYELQTSVKMLGWSLNALFEGLQVKCDIFSVGPLSHIVGTELESIFQSSKKKVFPSKASVIFLDRALDLAGALSQAVETQLGKALRVMPHLPGHVCDVSVSMTDVATCNGGAVFNMPLLAPGCLAHKNKTSEVDMLNTIFTSKIKEAVMEINRKLVQLGISEGLAFDNVNKSAPKALKRIILSYKDKPNLLEKHSGLLQQALGVVQSSEHPSNAYFDSLLAAEKLLIQNLSISKDSAGDDIIRLISSRKERGYKLVDILTLVAYLYALSDDGVLNEETESSVQATIMEAFFQDDVETAELVKDIAGDDAEDEDILIAVKRFFQILKKIGSLRKQLKKYRSIYKAGDVTFPASYVPLLKQIMEDVFNTSESTDVEYHSSGLRDFIKTGFSLFMNVAKPHPSDNPIIIVIVLGGITDSEIKMMYDIGKNHKDTKVFIGSTTLLTPSNVISDLFNVVKMLSDYRESIEE